jgi:ribosomal protein L40E
MSDLDVEPTNEDDQEGETGGAGAGAGAGAGQMCDNTFLPNLHAMLAPCQVCVFRLSDSDKKKLEKNGRHLNVYKTKGGCDECLAFPSQEGEDPVRLCRQCFFDTHKLRPKKEEPFSGSRGFSGVH